MIDASRSGDDVLDHALARLEAVVRTRRAHDASRFDSGMAWAFRFVDTVLLRSGGEGQSATARPARDAPDDSWSAWLHRYRQSIRDEWSRVGGALKPAALRLWRLGIARRARDAPAAGPRPADDHAAMRHLSVTHASLSSSGARTNPGKNVLRGLRRLARRRCGGHAPDRLEAHALVHLPFLARPVVQRDQLPLPREHRRA